MASGSITAGENGGNTPTFASPRTRTPVLIKKRGVVQLFTPAMADEPSLGVRPLFPLLRSCVMLYRCLLCINVSMNNIYSIFTVEGLMIEMTMLFLIRSCCSCLGEQPSDLHTVPFEV